MAKLIMSRAEMEKDRLAWLKLRNTGIGGSDAGVIVGLNTWKTPFTLWAEKTGQIEPEDLSDKESVYWGSVMEDIIANRFTELTGKKLRKSGMMQSEEHPFMLADVDRMVVGENAIVEIKTTASWNKAEWEGDNIPDTYYCQVLHYMIVTGAEKAYICCLIGGQQFVWKEVPFNKEEAEELIKAEQYFWEHNVIAKELPPVDGTVTCTEALKKKFPNGGEEEAVELDGRIENMLQDRDKLKAEIKAREDQVNKIENELRLVMGNNDFGRSASYNVWYKTTTRATFDSKGLQKAYPDIYEKFVGQSTYRKFKIAISKARTKEG